MLVDTIGPLKHLLLTGTLLGAWRAGSTINWRCSGLLHSHHSTLPTQPIEAKFWTRLTRDWSYEPPQLPPHHVSFQTLLALSFTHILHIGGAFLTCNLPIKNILSSSYDLHFEYRLHRYILRDETNKTRSHLHIFWRYFALVATYM